MKALSMKIILGVAVVLFVKASGFSAEKKTFSEKLTKSQELEITQEEITDFCNKSIGSLSLESLFVPEETKEGPPEIVILSDGYYFEKKTIVREYPAPPPVVQAIGVSDRHINDSFPVEQVPLIPSAAN